MSPNVTQFPELRPAGGRPPIISEPEAAPPRKPLMPIQRQILTLIAHGYFTSDIVAELGVSVQSVIRQRNRAIHRLGANGVTNAIALAYEQGWLPYSENAVAFFPAPPPSERRTAEQEASE